MCDFFMRSTKRKVFMTIWELLLIGLSVSADAFAVAMCKGVEMKKFKWSYAVVIAFFFGFFQMIMPLTGWAVASTFEKYITAFDHWIAFALLGFLGVKMIIDAFKKEPESEEQTILKLGLKTLLLMSIATSIDALAVGVTFAFLKVNIFIAIAIIGATTFCFSLLGVFIGTKAGDKFKNKAEFIGGLILFLLGLKILLEHLGVINF